MASERDTQRLTFGAGASTLNDDDLPSVTDKVKSFLIGASIAKPRQTTLTSTFVLPKTIDGKLKIDEKVPLQHERLGTDSSQPASEGGNLHRNEQSSSAVRDRRNRTTKEEMSIFGSAIESLFGKDSIFCALDDPRPARDRSNLSEAESGHDTAGKATPSEKRLSHSQEQRRHSDIESIYSEGANFKRIANK